MEGNKVGKPLPLPSTKVAEKALITEINIPSIGSFPELDAIYGDLHLQKLSSSVIPSILRILHSLLHTVLLRIITLMRISRWLLFHRNVTHVITNNRFS